MKSLLLGMLTLFLCVSAYAFPELTTHGYVNCTACHVSPSGGGVLTEYGRGLSKELLSLSGVDGEEGFLEGAVKPPSWLLPGGDVRAIQTYLNTPQVREGEFFLMQAELAAAIEIAKKWVAAASVGIKGGPDDVKDRKDLFSRIHYLMYRPSETTSIRAGRFMPQYGLNEPNHTIVTRDGLGFGEETESYNAEAAYAGDGWDLFVTGIFGRPDDLSVDHEKGFAISSSLNFLDKNKVGVSGYHGKNDSDDRWMIGAWGILAIAKNVFLLTELDHQWKTNLGPSENSQRGVAAYNRLGYELVKGLQLYATHQLSYLDLANISSRTDSFGPGIDFFPRPHFEFRAEWLRMRMLAVGPERFDSAWFLAHYYF